MAAASTAEKVGVVAVLDGSGVGDVSDGVSDGGSDEEQPSRVSHAAPPLPTTHLAAMSWLPTGSSGDRAAQGSASSGGAGGGPPGPGLAIV
jgi:hypothetical protein